MAIFEGTLRVRFHPTKNMVFLEAGDRDSTLTAADAEVVLSKAMEAAEARGAALCRYSFYVPEVSEMIPLDVKTIPVAWVRSAANVKGRVVGITLGRFKKPRLTVAPDDKKVSRKLIQDIA